MPDEPNPVRQKEMQKDPNHPGIYHVMIFHDDWCPEHPADA